MSEQVIIKKGDGVLSVQFNNPKKKNALNTEINNQLRKALDDAKVDDEIKVIYVTGSNGVFTTGNDFNNFMTSDKDDMISFFEDFINYLIDYPKVLIAGVNGMNVGMGFTMLLNFDIILCAESAFFMVPFIQTLQSPEATSSYLFPKYFGKLAGHLLLNGGAMKSEEAKNIGFVTQVYEDDDFAENALEYAKGVAKHPLRSLMLFKEMMTRDEKQKLKEVNAYECKILRSQWEYPEFVSVMKKFTKKKPEKTKF